MFSEDKAIKEHRINDIFKAHRKIIVYGGGKIGVKFLKWSVDCGVDTNKIEIWDKHYETVKNVNGLDVVEPKFMSNESKLDIFVIIAISSNNTPLLVSKIKKKFLEFGYCNIFLASDLMYHEKYDITLNMSKENSSHVKLLKRIKPNSTILEFGSSWGAMTRYMQGELNCQVYIIEMDEDAYKSSIKYAEDGFCGDATSLDWQKHFSHMTFDYILFADVLEHLYYPGDVLREAAKLLNPNGNMLISVPNIAHNSIIIDLLQNKFEYARYGILDNTHIRFFTYDSLLKMISDAGLTVSSEDAVYKSCDIDLSNIFNKEESKVLLNVLTNKKYGNIFQFIIEAQVR
ncbi:MAG: class I SAM-dependent methyltransferase [Defluviitaleaceae bacterium]|nr:class I SAM-dependent methyltransferase [Defluviitaleaceae bacterium]